MNPLKNSREPNYSSIVDTSHGGLETKVSFYNRDGVPFYRPETFHLAPTMGGNGQALPISVRDLAGSTPLGETYRNEGARLGSEGVRLLGNWPVGKVRIVGRVVGEARVDDGSSGYALEVAGKIAAVDSEMLGSLVAVEGSVLNVAGGVVCVRGEKCHRVREAEQIKWWGEVVQTREMLRKPWIQHEVIVIDDDNDNDQGGSDSINNWLNEDVYNGVNSLKELENEVTLKTPTLAIVEATLVGELVDKTLGSTPRTVEVAQRLLAVRFLVAGTPLVPTLLEAATQELLGILLKRLQEKGVICITAEGVIDKSVLLNHVAALREWVTNVNREFREIMLGEVLSLLWEKCTLETAVSLVDVVSQKSLKYNRDSRSWSKRGDQGKH